jgi:hypothetical protein
MVTSTSPDQSLMYQSVAYTVPIRIFSDEFIMQLEEDNALREGDREKILAKWKL